MADKIETVSTSRNTASSDDIILRESSRARLIFRPTVIQDNPKDPDAGVRGELLYQRKSDTENWTDVESKGLKGVRSGEEVKMPLPSLELKKLIEGVSRLNDVVHKHGVAPGRAEYVRVEPALKAFLETSSDELSGFLNENVVDASAMLMKVLKWVASTKDAENILSRFSASDLASLLAIETLSNIYLLNQVLEEWRANSGRAEESYWQDLLVRNPFLLNLLFHYPVAIVKERAYLGGKGIDNTGGNLADFLLKNRITQSAVIIEIKTPETQLVGKKYRTNAYSPSDELSGGIVQLLNYKQSLTEEINSLKREDQGVPEPFDPDCILIIGNVRKELIDKEKLRSFELFRKQLNRLKVVTFDELFEKAELTLSAFKASAKTV